MPNPTPPIERILDACLKVDSAAVRMYTALAGEREDSALAPLWKRLAEEEKSHIRFWARLLEMSRRGEIPDLLDSAESIAGEVEDMRLTVDDLCRQAVPATDADALRVALQLEFYMLHPCMAELFVFAGGFSSDFPSVEDYDNHIGCVLDSVRKVASPPPEMVILGSALSKVWKQNRRSAVLSTTDGLTGVLNRRSFFNTARPMLFMAHRMGTTVGVMMLDVDHFKKVNDRYGHQMGDRVLETMGSVLRRSLRTSDIVGRYGGEEFAVFLASVDPAFAVELAERMRRSAAEETAKINVPCTISIGVATGRILKDPAGELLEMVKKADDCLYRAKNEGRDRVVAVG